MPENYSVLGVCLCVCVWWCYQFKNHNAPVHSMGLGNLLFQCDLFNVRFMRPSHSNVLLVVLSRGASILEEDLNVSARNIGFPAELLKFARAWRLVFLESLH